MFHLSQLGYVHVAMMHTTSTSSEGPVEIAIVAAASSITIVEVLPNGPSTLSARSDGVTYTNGDVIRIALMQYQTDQVSSKAPRCNATILFTRIYTQSGCSDSSFQPIPCEKIWFQYWQ